MDKERLMSDVTTAVLSKIDDDLLLVGRLSYEEKQVLPSYSTIADWKASRTKFADGDTLNRMLADAFGRPCAAASDLDAGTWIGEKFICHKTGAVYHKELGDNEIALGGGLWFDSLPESDYMHCAKFLSELMAFEACRLKVKNFDVQVSDSTLLVILGHKPLPLREVSSLIGPIKGILKDVSSQFSNLELMRTLWKNEANRIKSSTYLGKGLYILSGDGAEIVAQELSGSADDIHAIPASDLAKRLKTGLSGTVIVQSAARSMSALLAEMADAPISVLTALLSELHIKFLLPEICEHCHKKTHENAYSQMHYTFSLPEGMRARAGNGCDHCHLGYSGGIVIHESITLQNKEKFVSVISEYVKKNASEPKSWFFNIYSAAFKESHFSTYKAIANNVEVGKLSIQDIESLIF